MGILHVKQTPEGFSDYLRSHFSRGRDAVVEDHYEGWFLGHFFSIGYVSRNAVGSKYHPIRNRMLGYIQEEKDGSKVTWLRFQGFTDPVALLTIFVCCVIFLALVRQMGGLFQGSNSLLLQYSLLFTVAAALVTWTSTKWSREGELGYKRLKELLYPELAEKEKEEEY